MPAHVHAKTVFRQHGGSLRMSEALRAGVSRRELYAMRDEGVATQLSRGVFRLASLPPLSNPDLSVVASRAPNAVVCLISALAFHELTTQIPHAVDIAVSRGAAAPRIDYPPVRVHWFSGTAFTSGIETPVVDGRRLRVYSPEKSIADAFKYRNKIGTDIAIEALKTWRARGRPQYERLLEQARACRVERVMSPYLEAIL